MAAEPKVVVVGPSGDLATNTTVRWARRLRQVLHSEAQLLEGADAVRPNVERAFPTGSARALAFFGHGDTDELVAHGGLGGSVPPILAAGESTLRFTWIYAMACNAAKELGQAVVRGRCEVFIGYSFQFVVADVPEDAIDRLADFVIQAAVMLHQGERSEKAIRRKLRLMAAVIEEEYRAVHPVPISLYRFLSHLQTFEMLHAA